MRSKNSFKLSVYNVGYLDKGEHLVSVNNKLTKVYTVWHSMMQRCYDSGYQSNKPSYIGCYVVEKWKNYQNFAKWFEENYIEGFALDKDLLIKNNKIYSFETCCFIPSEINVLFTNRKNHRGKYPLGVKKHNSKFRSCISKKGKQLIIGDFNSIVEAFESYKISKESYIKEIANEFKPLLNPEVYEALINYKIDEND